MEAGQWISFLHQSQGVLILWSLVAQVADCTYHPSGAILVPPSKGLTSKCRRHMLSPSVGKM